MTLKSGAGILLLLLLLATIPQGALAQQYIASIGDSRKPLPVFGSYNTINFKAMDLCGRLLTSGDDSSAFWMLDYTSPTGGQSAITAKLEADGTTAIQLSPGVYNVSLYIKGVYLSPVLGPNPLVVNQSANTGDIIYIFPVGDLVLRTVFKDINEPIPNILLQLDYSTILSGVVPTLLTYSEQPRLTNNSGLATFTKAPLGMGSNSKVTITAKTTKDTPYIRHPEEENKVVGTWETNLAYFTPFSCSVGPIDLPVNISSGSPGGGASGYYKIFFGTCPGDVGSINFAGKTYTSGEYGYYPPGTYQIEANVPQGYIFYRWAAGAFYKADVYAVSVANRESQRTTATIREGNYSKGFLIALFKWFTKFRGVVVSHESGYVIKVKIEELLLDTSNRLKIGEIVEVSRNTPFTEIDDGDYVEVHGLGAVINCDSPEEGGYYITIEWPDHYIKKIESVRVWTDKSIYYVGEKINIYVNPSPAYGVGYWIIIYIPNGTNLRYNLSIGENVVSFRAGYPAGQYKVELWGAVVYPGATPKLYAYSYFEVRESKTSSARCATLITVKPDTPTIDDYVEFTLSISCEEGSEVREINLYVDGSLAGSWQDEGNLRFSSKYTAGTHTYHLVIVDKHGQESRVPEKGEYSFNVLVTDGVAGPPTLWITPFEIVVEYEGKSYRAFYAINISASDIPPDPNKDRTAFYTWMYTKRNWYVLDSSNQVVTDEDVYVKIAIAAETAFNILGKNPDYLRERAYFFRDMKFYGTVATILKKIGEHLAGYIPKAALGFEMPSAVGVERFGVIVEFADYIKKLEKVDVDSAITLVAFGYLTDVENALLRASELAEPVYSELMSNPSSPKAHVEYSKMLEFNKLIRNESKGFAGINMLYQLHREGVKGYIESVIKAIIASADPTGLSAVASKIQEVPEVREFFDQMCAWEAEQHIRDAAFERGARSFAKVAREYAETTKRGDSGGVVTVREGKIVSLEAASGVEIRGEVQNRKIVLIVDSNTPRGKTITVDLDSKSLPITKIEEVAVIFDGEKIKMADDLADVLNPNDDEKPEYFILWGSKGAQVFISIPSFSAHTIEIIHTPSIQGDVNNDGLVDYRDLATVVARYGSRQGDPSYLEAADVNLDGVIDYKDLALVVSHYGESR
jgi:hypothetical protein